jgi:hypothetical protein
MISSDAPEVNGFRNSSERGHVLPRRVTTYNQKLAGRNVGQIIRKPDSGFQQS